MIVALFHAYLMYPPFEGHEEHNRERCKQENLTRSRLLSSDLSVGTPTAVVLPPLFGIIYHQWEDCGDTADGQIDVEDKGISTCKWKGGGV